eukprot:CAMPEP_0183450294 /NCGR_PEP_ID=MMETSP0370-20130417/112279_1 /TAXON_ID=268820 /ORGANISM="Peridinium aciculiferum, Strain PAER-2" /LENGTH=32 /DNA_ID= /DNA_START= /DNA_END= /DNA_ORIENTATION=
MSYALQLSLVAPLSEPDWKARSEPNNLRSRNS